MSKFEIRLVHTDEEAEGFIPRFCAVDVSSLQDAILSITDNHQDILETLFSEKSIVDRVVFRVPVFSGTVFNSDEVEWQYEDDIQAGADTETWVVVVDDLPDDREEVAGVCLTQVVTVWKDGCSQLAVVDKHGLEGWVTLS